MDALKSMLEKRKLEKSDKQTFQPKGVQMKQEEEKLKQEQQDRLEKEEFKKKQKLDELSQFYSGKIQTQKKVQIQNMHDNLIKDKKDEIIVENTEQMVEDDSEEEYDLRLAPPLAKSEVVKNLRKIGEVVTYFGENDWDRYKRYKANILKIFEAENKADGNTFYKDMKISKDDFNRQDKLAPSEEQKEQYYLEKINAFDPTQFNQEAVVKKIEQIEKNKFQDKIEQKQYKSFCEEVYIWIRRIIVEWEKQLDEVKEQLRKKPEYIKETAQYRQCRRHIKFLLQLLHQKQISNEILNGLYVIISYCYIRDYVKAHNKYLTLAIGNAPWPMGVTMVGIHDRSGRSKIFSSQIAHILNDENQRKYLQAFKRLVTICQKVWPSTDISKMFEQVGVTN